MRLSDLKPTSAGGFYPHGEILGLRGWQWGLRFIETLWNAEWAEQLNQIIPDAHLLNISNKVPCQFVSGFLSVVIKKKKKGNDKS
jgi:hypothetical protein